ncbi:MAG: GemA protein [Rhodobacteraceae bacterium]|nr:GemA protein [Paracoccaceae bacterium]
MTAHALIHVGLKQLGLVDEDARDLYQRVTGSRSLRAMTPQQHRAVVAELERLGFKRSSKPRANRLSGPYAAKLQALWIAAHNLGIIDTASDAALIAFVKRQTGLSHGRFLRHAGDATKVIEALKDWMRRESGDVSLFTHDKLRPPLLNDHRMQILLAQWTRLVRLDAAPAASLDAWVARMQPGIAYADLTKVGWIDLMNILGAKLRAAKTARARASARGR